MIGNSIAMNLRRLRSVKGLSQKKIATASKLSRIAYSNIESGKADPRVRNLQKIADVLNVGIQELMAPLPQLASLRFRSRNTLTTRDKNKREQIAINSAFWLRDFNELEESLKDKRTYTLKDISKEQKDPKSMAEIARSALGLGPDEAIVDICGLLESKAGIKLHFIVSDLNKFNGLSLFDEKGCPAIGVNVSDTISTERQIFTVAHELGHLLLHKNSYKNEEIMEKDEQETQADEFASYFLIPQEAFRKSWDENKGLHWVDNILHTKRVYKVSFRTILRRLIEEGRVDKSIYHRFDGAYKIKFKKDLKNNREPNPLDKIDFLEDRLSLLVRKAFENEKITFSRAAEILKIDIENMRDRVNSWKLVESI